MFATVETASGETLNVHYDDGRYGGNAILTFLIGAYLYCEKASTEDVQWFSELENVTPTPICSLIQPLLQSFNPNGQWTIFKQDEYEFFQKRNPDILMTSIEFMKFIEEMEQKWVSVGTLLTTVEQVINLLRKENLNSHSAFDPMLIADDFQALHKTLTILAERNADKVRISFN